MALSPAEQQKKRLLPLENVDKDGLKIHEIYASIQGESSYAGLPCTFIRTTACNLRCHYCDTPHAFYEGTVWSIAHVLERVHTLKHSLVEITGGEPLLQANVLPLMTKLCDLNYKVLLETSGSRDTAPVDKRVIKIIDLKTPSSGEAAANLYNNLEHLLPHDEIKFVLGNREDYEWAKSMMHTYDLTSRCTVLMGIVWNTLANQELAEWIIQDHLHVRMQVQTHKWIWSPEARGV